MCVPYQPSSCATQIYDMLITASPNCCQIHAEAALTRVDFVLELAIVICDDVSLAALDSDDLAMLACTPNTTHSIRG